MKQISKGLEDTQNIAREFLKTLGVEGSRHQVSGATVVALQGDLGAGKTAFTQAVGRELGLEGNLQSPTFVIEKVYEIDYKGFKKLIHIDAYRLERDEELLHLGWQELISEPENLIFIEWPENVAGIIPEDTIRINLEFVDDTTRNISYES